jgi:hypothetical protein
MHIRLDPHTPPSKDLFVDPSPEWVPESETARRRGSEALPLRETQSLRHYRSFSHHRAADIQKNVRRGLNCQRTFNVQSTRTQHVRHKQDQPQPRLPSSTNCQTPDGRFGHSSKPRSGSTLDMKATNPSTLLTASSSRCIYLYETFHACPNTRDIA